MKKENTDKLFLNIFCVFIALPVLIYALDNYPRRSILKEAISIITIFALCLMISQFFLTRMGNKFQGDIKLSSVMKIHKYIGYIFISVLLLHPFFIVFPRYFEAGVDPMDAFITMISSFETNGIIMGMIAYLFMLILGVTSLFRKKIPMKYTSWRMFHGIISILFIIFASWHAIDLGRHMNSFFSIYIVLISGAGIALILRNYILKSTAKMEENK